MVDVYFVTAGNPQELDVIERVKPRCILVSYFYFRNKNLGDIIKRIGYKPKIMLDSGAFSAYRRGRPVNLEEYMNYIKKNKEHLDGYITLDVLVEGGEGDLKYKGDSKTTKENFVRMKEEGLNPIPVFHYKEDEKHLEFYVNRGEKRIAIGGTVPERDKGKVADWFRLLPILYKGIDFHLLGSSSLKIIDTCDVKSVDSSTWIMQAVKGLPRHIPGNARKDRTKRMIWNMRKYTERFG